MSILTLIAMRLRGVPYGMIVDSRIMAVKAGLDLTINQLEEHYLAEGHLIPTIQALIAAEKAGMDLSWKQACAIDLATKGTAKPWERLSARRLTRKSSTAPTRIRGGVR